jgi:hypothetical protein
MSPFCNDGPQVAGSAEIKLVMGTQDARGSLDLTLGAGTDDGSAFLPLAMTIYLQAGDALALAVSNGTAGALGFQSFSNGVLQKIS